MNERRVYRLSDDDEPAPTEGIGYVLFLCWVVLGYVLGRYL